MQKGTIRQWGRWWQLKYRETVIQGGVRIRKDVYKKLAPIDRAHQPRPDGSPPENVRALADVELAPLNAGLREPQSADSLLSFLERFLARGEGGRGRRLRDATVGAYRDMFRILLPHLPDMELRRVRTPDIDRLLRRVAVTDGEDKRAQTTYRNLKNFLSSAFRYAVRNGLVEFNPVRDAAIPEGNDADTHAYSLKEIRQIMGAVKKPVAKAAIMVAFFTGLRKEEITGLRWEDYTDGVLNIKRAVVEGRLVDVKTKASKAPAPVIATVKKVLANHRKHNSGDGFIFHGRTGQPLRLENLARRDIIPDLKKAKIEWHGIHACRRGLSTVLHDLGIAELTIKHILRHSSSDVTAKHYIKASLKRNRAALEKVEKEYKKVRLRRSLAQIERN